MIPLTELFYAPGKISIQTKFSWSWVPISLLKSVKDTINILERKGKVVDANSDNAMASAEANSRNVQVVHRLCTRK